VLSKGEFVILNIWNDGRAQLIERLDFYHAQAKKRILDQFRDIESEAERYAEESYNRRGQWFNPDTDDPASSAEAAWDDGIAYYGLLEDLRKQMILSIAAGMYHEWDKQFRDWLDRELGHNFSLDKLRPDLWKQDIGTLFDMLDSWGWDLKAQGFHDTIDSCRLIVNVYKHGHGTSLNRLKERFPQYLRSFGASGSFGWDYVHYNQLEVGEEALTLFHEAFRNFWKYVPARTIAGENTPVPAWFEKALTRKPRDKEKPIAKGAL
jgi:hypothetical protein